MLHCCGTEYLLHRISNFSLYAPCVVIEPYPVHSICIPYAYSLAYEYEICTYVNEKVFSWTYKQQSVTREACIQYIIAH